MSSPDTRRFGTTASGSEVSSIRLEAGELRVVLLNWGAVVQDVRLAGTPWPLALGSDQLAAYEGVMDYFGAIVGPVANRIGGARAEIDGQQFQFDANDGPNCLHGGIWGTQRQIWEIVEAGASHVRLRLTLRHGHGGFPGNRTIEAEYRVAAPAVLTLQIRAETDAPTLMNLASHCYWNLDGGGRIAGHRLSVCAERYLPTDGGLPTGEVAPVSPPFDLREGRVLDLSEGFDHNWCLADVPRTLTRAAMLTGRKGVQLAVETTEPGLQVFDGATLDTVPFIGHTGQPYGANDGIALEPQRWPDAPNHPQFPSIKLRPGEVYEQTTRFSFSRG